jgi:hypothetical protein
MRTPRWSFPGLVLILVLILITSLPITAQDDDPPTIQGEVVQVHQNVRTRNGGAFDELTVRTRQGEQMRLRLGAAGECPGCVQAGDTIRARVMAGGPTDGALNVRQMKVRNSGQSYRFRNDSGDLLQTRERARSRTMKTSGTCTRRGAGEHGGGHRGGGHHGGGRH